MSVFITENYGDWLLTSRIDFIIILRYTPVNSLHFPFQVSIVLCLASLKSEKRKCTFSIRYNGFMLEILNLGIENLEKQGESVRTLMLYVTYRLV